MTASVVVRSFAKINLGLEIVGRRPDGYHDIRTLFQTISLADEMDFEDGPEGTIDLAGDDASVDWGEANLITRTVRLLRERSGTTRGVRVRVRKSVPAGRGLGGGSSNAAACLLALNGAWGLGLGPTDLAALAVRLGADVPFFLHGGLCLGEGIGERLTRLPDLPSFACLLVFPPYPISTAAAYGALPASLTSSDNVSKMRRFLESGDFDLLENDLERVVFKAHPELEGWTRSLREHGAFLSRLSGSGSAVFGLFRGEAEARRAQERMAGASAIVLARTLAREEYWARLGAGV